MKNLTLAAENPEVTELRQLLSKTLNGVSQDVDILQDVVTALSREPPRVDLAKRLLDQTIQSIKLRMESTKKAQKQIKPH